MDGIDIEKADRRQQVIQKLYEDKNNIIKKYINKEISLKERALQLTEAEIEYNDNLNIGFPSGKFIKKYPDLFTLDKIYEQNIEEHVNIELTIIVSEPNQNAINYLLKENQIEGYDYFVRDSHHFYRFFHSIEYNFISRKYNENKDNEDRKYNYLEILDPNGSNYHSINIPRFNFIIGLTPMGKIFGDANYVLKGNFAKLEYACYLALNNGGQIYSLKEIRKDNRGTSPKFHEDLQGIFRSDWEANIARILNYKNIEWEFEREAFLIQNNPKEDLKHTYHPDFFLNNNIIIEVKGFWDRYSLSQVYAFKNQVKEYSLKIIDGDMYYPLIYKYKEIVPSICSDKNDYLKIPSIENVPIVGIQRRERVPFIKELSIGNKVYLKRDKDNKFDSNAISVVNANGDDLGFMGKEWAFIYAEKMDLGMEFEATIKKKEPKVISLSIQRTNIDQEIFYDFLKL